MCIKKHSHDQKSVEFLAARTDTYVVVVAFAVLLSYWAKKDNGKKSNDDDKKRTSTLRASRAFHFYISYIPYTHTAHRANLHIYHICIAGIYSDDE